EEEQYKQNFVEAVVSPNLIKIVTIKLNEALLKFAEEHSLLTGEQLEKVKKEFSRREKNILVEYSTEIPEFLHQNVDTMLKKINPSLEQVAGIFSEEMEDIFSAVRKLSKDELEYLLLGHSWR
ncbi:MAG: hypothetical protein ACFFBD_29670, partial [Candidatus Hodarchaeota archaeon]